MNRSSSNRTQIRATFARLARIPRDDLAPALGGFVDDEADRVRAEAPIETGDLRDSVGATPAKFARGRIRASVVVASDHAAAEEYGTTHQAPDPFVRRAIRGGERRLRTLILSAVANARK